MHPPRVPNGEAAMALRKMSVAVVIVMLSSPVVARQPDAFDICAHNNDPAARLACFDREQAARNAADPVSAPAAGRPAPASSTAPSTATTSKAATASAPAAASPASSAASDVGLDARELRRQRAQRGEPQPADPAPIEAMLIKVIQRQPLISAFELDNGQIWEQSEAMRTAAVPNQKVMITHGVLGAFFLKTADGTVVVRVHRLK
jgi:hypothetical protein